MSWRMRGGDAGAQRCRRASLRSRNSRCATLGHGEDRRLLRSPATSGPIWRRRPTRAEDKGHADDGADPDIDALGYGINEQGLVVGSAQAEVGRSRAALFADATVIDLDTLGGADRSQIVANSRPSGLLIHGTAYRPDPVLVAIELRSAQVDHCLVTMDEQEIEALDAGTVTGWIRTGETFLAYPLDTPGAVDVCRFRSAQALAPASTQLCIPSAGSAPGRCARTPACGAARRSRPRQRRRA